MAYREELIEYLLQFLNDNRRELLDRDVSLRSNQLTLVLEDFKHPHNISACIRTSDCFGLRDVHIIENKIYYENNPKINRGSDKWVNIKRYNQAEFNTPVCIDKLKSEGYKIVVTSPHKGSFSIRELDLSQKTAIIMGSEADGISDHAKESADAFLKIDMPGFTESLNVSVAAGIVLETLSHRLRNDGYNWQLSDDERAELYLINLSKMVPNYKLLEKRFAEGRSDAPDEPVFSGEGFGRSTEVH